MKEQVSEAVFDRDAPEAGAAELGYLLAEVSKLHRARAHLILGELGLYQGQNFVLTALSE